MERRVKECYRDHVRCKFDFDLTNTQVQIILSRLVEGKDVFAVMPTGAGKSMTFIVPPLLTSIHHKSTALVIAPILALSIDQAKNLRQKGVRACVLQKEMAVEEKRDLRRGEAQMIFCSPEMLRKHLNWMERNYREKLCLIAFDEVHCVSDWGKDFRPDYRKMAGLRSLFDVPVLALTATATQQIKRDVMAALCMQEDTVMVAASPDRPEIFLSMKKSSKDYDKELGWVVRHIAENSINSKKILIYTRNLNDCSKLFEWISLKLDANAFVIDNEGCMRQLVGMYHAHLTPETKKSVISEFTEKDGAVKLVVATVAFGMGVQIPDITATILWGLPATLLDYWQMSGRCARSKGAQGISATYCHPSSVFRTKDITMRSVAKSTVCLRAVVLGHLSLERNAQPNKTKAACNLHCSAFCRCSYCMCCSVCRTNCKCPNKSDNLTVEFFGQNSRAEP